MRGLLAVLSLLAAPLGAPAADAPASFARDVRPFLVRYCIECHYGKEPEGGLNLETYQGLAAGGDHGPVFTPGKADESRIVRMVEGKSRPVMPPKKARQPKPGEAAVLRAWIDAGARDDSGTVTTTLPDIKPQAVLPAPVTAVAYRPDGKLLAAATQGAVVRIDSASGVETGRLPVEGGKITALAFSPDGSQLAVAVGRPGTAGLVHLFRGADTPQSSRTIQAHHDLIHALAFSPDGKLLATCGYDRLVKLWDASTGKEVRELRDHSDAVHGVAFSPDGKLLASCGADRAVKVWDVATGKRLYTLGEATDWVYAVAWHPAGRLLAAAGVDRSIRVWEATAQGGRVVHSVFAHEGPVLRLAYAADGSTLYSLSEDRTAKAWDAARMVERTVYPRQADTPLSLAVRPDHKQLAVGRYDGGLVLLDEAAGKPQAEPLPAKPKPPELKQVTPPAGPRGKALKLRFDGKYLAGATEVTSTIPGLTATIAGTTGGSLEVTATIPPTTPAGVYQLGVKTSGGESAKVPFIVDLFPAVREAEGNASVRTAQKVTLPVTIVGAADRAGDADYFRFEATAGQEVGVQILTAAVGSKLEPVLELYDDAGTLLAEGTTGLLGHTCAKAGGYVLAVRDKDYRGGSDMGYRLHVGSVPVVTGVFPLGLRRGTEAEVRLEGVHLAARTARIFAPAAAEPGTKLPVSAASPHGTPLGSPSVVVGEFPEVVSDKSMSMPVPGTANGRIAAPGASQTWTFTARKGQRLVVETHARRLGSPLDSVIEILDAAGRPLPLATLRCLARTDVAFRDHDSASPGIRIETWSELAVNDYLLVGGELIRIKALPRNPDDDCQFFQAGGRRVAFLGTSPTFHPMGRPMYKVAIHPPGTAFPPNGLPVVTLYHRNDDGGHLYDKDSLLFFDPPADGDYRVRVSDARGQGGPNYAYRLTVRPPRPDFTISLSPSTPTLARGEGVPVSVTADRLDGFNGPIEVRAEGLPPGFSAPATTILPDENTTSFTVFAEPDAMIPAGAKPWKLVATALIDGKQVVHEARGDLPKFRDPPEIVTTTDVPEVTIRPGSEARLTVRVERRNGFKGRIPLDVKGLPHGVRVLDVGLNGILVTERDTSRTVVLYAEPWVKPTEHPVVVLARHEKKGTEHAARSVLLRVAGR